MTFSEIKYNLRGSKRIVEPKKFYWTELEPAILSMGTEGSPGEI